MTPMKRFIVFTVAGLLASGAQIRGQQNDAVIDKLFASAEHKATVEGDVRSAIEEYRRIVRTAGTNRAVAAQALLRIAESYRTLGDSDSEREVYRQIQSEYPEQKHILAAVSANTSAAQPMALIWNRAPVDVYGGLATNARVSPNGRYIAYPDWSTGNLTLRDLVAGTERTLTADGDLARQAYAQVGVFSPDSRQIAFSFLSAEARRYQVRLVSPTAADPPRLIFDQEDVEWVQPYDWSPDGARIALQIRRLDGTGQIALLDVKDGVFRVLVSFPWVAQSGEMRFSPDGHYLAFDQSTDEGPVLAPGSSRREVFVIPVDGSCCKTAVVEYPSDEHVLGWTPGGSDLLFWSNRDGRWSLWAIAIQDGKSVAAARPLDHVSVNGAFAPLGLTAAGDVFVASLRASQSGIKTAEVDLATGRLATVPIDLGPEFANPFYGWASYAWAPNGRTLAVYRRSPTNGSVFTFKDVRSGAVRETRARDGECPSGMEWSRDGTFLICNGAYTGDANRTSQAGIVRADPSTGRVTFVTDGGSPSLSPDGRTVYLLRVDESGPQRQVRIIARELASGTERELLRRPALYRLRVSPDGRWLVAVSRDVNTRAASVIYLSSDGSEVRELLATTGIEGIGEVFWSRDSLALFLAKTSGADARPRFVRVTLAGEETAYPELELGTGVQVHPDSRHVAFFVPAERSVEIHRIRDVFGLSRRR